MGIPTTNEQIRKQQRVHVRAKKIGTQIPPSVYSFSGATEDPFLNADTIHLEFSGENGAKRVNLPSIFVGYGEVVKVTITKEQKGIYSTEKVYNGGKENAKVTEGEKVEGIKDNYLNLLNKISNFSIGLFVFSAAVFLLLCFTNMFISPIDAIFGFLLSVITAGVFYFDKLYRRNLNSGSRQ
jgi:hypothetical protein